MFSDRPNTFPWPPVILVSTLAVGYSAQGIVPFQMPIAETAAWIGIALIALAIAIDIAAMITLARAKTTILPHQKSNALVTQGIFSISRNPIYVANVLLIAGIGGWTGNPWIVLLAPLSGFATHHLAILREEQHLTAQFGEPYLDYVKSVRRWL